jgi:phosphatidate cytidylyltransferase
MQIDISLANGKVGKLDMDIKKRLIPCVLIVVITLGCVLLSRPTRLLFFMVLAVMSAFEMEMVLSQAGMAVNKWLLSGYIVIQGVLCWVRVDVLWMVALFALTAFVVFFWGVLCPKRGGKFVVSGLFALLWPFGFYAIILHACASDIWLPVLAMSVLGAWACDSMALLGGKAFGKRKVAPLVSPNKTWAGCIVGGLAAILAGWLIYLVLRYFAYVPMVPCMIITFVASCFGQIGDLAASLIKRMAGVKDYGHLMPEHGGIMDKTDSMLFAIPAAYLGMYIVTLF